MNSVISLSSFIGQKKTTSALKIGIRACQASGTAMDHILFYGPAGVGKTSLAQSVANEMKARIKIIQGINIGDVNDLIGIISSLREGDILFIDEIHTVKKEAAEILYPALENQVIDLIIGKGKNKRSIRIPLPNFTLIAATTNLGNIAKSLEERFGYIFYLEEYTKEEMEEIVAVKGREMGLDLGNQEIEEIVASCRGIPRNAMRILRRIRDYRLANEEATVQNIIRSCGFIYRGLGDLDIKYLMALRESEGSLTSISHRLNLDERTIVNKIEPYMYSNGWIVKNNRGRSLSKEGRRIMEKLVKAREQKS